jgi:O-antigen ligase
MIGNARFQIAQFAREKVRGIDPFALASCAALALVPPIFAAATFDLANAFNPLRQYSLPIVALEMFVIIAAIMSGLQPGSAFMRLSNTTRMAAAMLSIVAMVSTILAPVEPIRALMLFPITAVHGIFALAIHERLGGEWRSARMPLLWSGLIGMTLFALVAIPVSWLGHLNTDFNWRHFGAGVSHIRQVGHYGLVLTGITGGFLIFADLEKQRKTLILLLLLGFVVTHFSGSRAAFGAAVLGCAVLAFAIRSRFWRFALVSGSLFVLAIPISMLVAPHADYGAGTIIRRTLGLGMESGSVTEYTSGRWEIWSETFRRFLDRPWIGHGEGQARHGIETLYGGFNHPHNSILQFLYQWGLVGTIALACLVWRALRNTRSAIATEPQIALPAMAIFWSLAAFSLFEGSFYHPLPIVFSLLSLVLLATTKACAETKMDNAR